MCTALSEHQAREIEARAAGAGCPDLELHHMGSRTTVFPRAAWAVRRGLAGDADVVLEVVNGITFLTPLWLRTPRVTLVHHIHRDHYVREMGNAGRIAAFLLETLPLRLLYRRSRVCAGSAATPTWRWRSSTGSRS